MSKKTEDLTSQFKPLAERLLIEARAKGIVCVVIDTLRTVEEHQHNLKVGASKAKLSKHLPRKLRGLANASSDDEKSDAIDVCPIDLLKEKHWAPGSKLWQEIGVIGESLGLTWGGRWKKLVDLGHFEMPTEILRDICKK